MRVDALLQQGRAGLRGGCGVGAQALGDGIAAETAPGAGAQQRVAAVSSAYVQPGAQEVLNGAVGRDGVSCPEFRGVR
jgi:hypothetical protein